MLSPIDMVLSPQKLLAGIGAALVWTLLSFGAGYLYHAHRAEVAEAGHEASQEAVTGTTAAAAENIDSHALMTLNGKLIAATNQAAALRYQIEAQSHETPAPPDCRLPDRLRDAINATLAPGQAGAAAEVR